MKINEVIIESKQVSEAPAWLGQAAKKIGSRVLNKVPFGLGKGKAAELAGSADLTDTVKNLYREYSAFVGRTGKTVGAATAADMSNFLKSKGVETEGVPTDTPTAPLGNARTAFILKQKSIEAMGGTPDYAAMPPARASRAAPTSTPPSAPTAGAPSSAVAQYKAKKAGAAPAVAPAKQDSGVEGYIQQWASTINASKRPQRKINLAKEVVNFLADRAGSPEAARGVQQAAAVIKNAGFDPSTNGKLLRALKKGIRLEKRSYAALRQLLEMTNLTLRDLGMWVVLKESTDSHMTLRSR